MRGVTRRNGQKQKPTPRRTLRYQHARAAFIAQAPPVCGVCRQHVDKRLDGRHPWGPQIDHKVPVESGHPFWDVTNWQLVHAKCNKRKGIGVELEAPGEWSGWLSPDGHTRWSIDWGGGTWTGPGAPPPDPPGLRRKH
jgi:5-methylcytosine-specific restriction endonuclease McrA